MNISKALKEKARLLKKYNETLELAVSNNSKDVKVVNYYSSKDLIAEATMQLGELVDLKVKIHEASAPMRQQIFLLGELKNLCAKLKRMSTHEGEVENYGSSTPRVMAVSLNEENKNILIKGIETQIDAIQDNLDQFNATTEI